MDKPTKKELLIIVVAVVVTVILAFGAVLVWSQDTLVRDGATCDIPDGYNSAPYSADFNARGMGEFCVFPVQPWVDAITDLLEDYTPPDLPECVDGLVVGPAEPVYPCYRVDDGG